ncbi:hypothetical protein G4G28_20655 [Massilia sp. Dwa41.01b]|uniref:hypothetical protein n=1 Tax=unclassified Massilia TaxID=2609279 RepID=UPI0015FF23D6|nr:MULTISPECIES: hypothetical protein [unclassified Massilia]QNA90312.1 hypothetical protein G4G28_20655 [Massilia sp. Dwa41.01b]QNB01212.1 hypothetical protein G4G31_24280 [Massilia sp. Se16.2.3]
MNAPNTVVLDDVSVGGIEGARRASILWDIVLRAFMVAVVSGIFIWLNWQVIDFVLDGLKLDEKMLAAKSIVPADRLVTSEVMMALIGATVIQTGAGFIAITSYLFPKRISQEK